ncbi:hypothetical protein DPMN_170054 [Dreissena polymorpha]|uniref:Uncharacterized protein n=1 Tax=Dreissena polymorpha TaxID=45954 RepID=A0A9D4DX61_DREPO|nr:hypothetical protein DPMN_170054 [Dreissena polymorpha]
MVGQSLFFFKVEESCWPHAAVQRYIPPGPIPQCCLRNPIIRAALYTEVPDMVAWKALSEETRLQYRYVTAPRGYGGKSDRYTLVWRSKLEILDSNDLI